MTNIENFASRIQYLILNDIDKIYIVSNYLILIALLIA